MWIAIIVIVATVILIIVGAVSSTQCPNCKKFYAMEQIDKTIIATEEISKIEELKIRDKQGKEIGTQEQRRYGTKITDQITRCCKFCGYIEKYNISEDKY